MSFFDDGGKEDGRALAEWLEEIFNLHSKTYYLFKQ